MQSGNLCGTHSAARGLQVCHCEEAVGRRGNLGKALPEWERHRRPYTPPGLTVAALSERLAGWQSLRHAFCGARPSSLSLRGPKGAVAISGRQLRFCRGFPVVYPVTARLPRRFAPRNDKSEGIVRSAKPLYNLPARRALTERRYRRNRFSRFYRQPVRIGSIAPGPAVPSPTTLRWQPCKLSTIHFPFAARRVPLQSLIRLHIAEPSRRAAGILAERIGEGR